MAQAPIKFGTDGWRAVIADDFTFENLERVARATARWIQTTHGAEARVVIGHDTRFMGRQFTVFAAQVLASHGLHVIMSDTVATTPAVSWATREYGAGAGIVITASHNPPHYNGFKIKAHFGGPAPPEIIAAVEAELDRPVEGPALRPVAALREEGLLEERALNAAYVDMLREQLDIDAIIASGVRVAHDAMYGAGQGIVSELLGEGRVVELRSEWNPGFGGQAPEPIERNLAVLAETLVREGCAVGLANDGDADRIGLLDEKGEFVTSHLLMALLVKYLHQVRGLTGEVIKTFSTTHLLDKMGAAYGLPVETTPIGFKYIAPKMVVRDVLVGGEESGGIAVMGHIPERDGIYIGLLAVEMMVKRGKTLSELVEELFEEFGPHHTYRLDVHTTDAKKQAALVRLKDEGGLDEIAGVAVDRVDAVDGFKHMTAEGWLLVRPSGTEPVLRVYAEAASLEAAQALVEDAADQLGVAEGGA